MCTGLTQLRTAKIPPPKVAQKCQSSPGRHSLNFMLWGEKRQKVQVCSEQRPHLTCVNDRLWPLHMPTPHSCRKSKLFPQAAHRTGSIGALSALLLCSPCPSSSLAARQRRLYSSEPHEPLQLARLGSSSPYQGQPVLPGHYPCQYSKVLLPAGTRTPCKSEGQCQLFIPLVHP